MNQLIEPDTCSRARGILSARLQRGQKSGKLQFFP